MPKGFANISITLPVIPPAPPCEAVDWMDCCEFCCCWFDCLGGLTTRSACCLQAQVSKRVYGGRTSIKYGQSQSQQQLPVGALHILTGLHSPRKELRTLIDLLRLQDLQSRNGLSIWYE